ncbi:MAG: DUF2442 domain-containing protein [Betaproteobacteria bacterium]|nr:DUF2442 domain-containing protein [Betaproteobacteria bacterium]
MSEQNKIKLTQEVLAKAAAAGEKELERPRAKAVRYDAERVRLVMELVSGAVLDIPLPMTERLANASERERSEMVLAPFGLGIHWPLIDEDLYVPRLVDRYTASLQRAA